MSNVLEDLNNDKKNKYVYHYDGSLKKSLKDGSKSKKIIINNNKKSTNSKDIRHVPGSTFRLFFTMVSFLTIITLLNSFLLSVNIFRNDPNVANAFEQVSLSGDGSSNEQVFGDSNKKSDNSKIVNKFAGNKVFTEFGSKIKLKDNSAEVQDSLNCQTPVVPPIENGCFLVFAPSVLSLPTKGVYFDRMSLKGDFPEGSKIVVSIKNYETGKITSQIGVFGVINNNISFSLPPQIDTVEGLKMTFWLPQNSILKINNINLSYFYIESLVKVKGIIKDRPNSVGSLVLDKNGNNSFDSSEDIIWSCQPSFPGVLPVRTNDKGEFDIYRDDSCYKEAKSSQWSSDQGKQAVPLGSQWLLVFENGKYVYNLDFSEYSEDRDWTLNL
jgi:hypothetical protein